MVVPNQSALVVNWENVAGRARYSCKRDYSVHDRMGGGWEKNLFNHSDRYANAKNLFRIAREIRNPLFQIFPFSKSINNAHKVG